MGEKLKNILIKISEFTGIKSLKDFLHFIYLLFGVSLLTILITILRNRFVVTVLFFLLIGSIFIRLHLCKFEKIPFRNKNFYLGSILLVFFYLLIQFKVDPFLFLQKVLQNSNLSELDGESTPQLSFQETAHLPLYSIYPTYTIYPTHTFYPTYTVYPTHTISPTHTLYPAYTPETIQTITLTPPVFIPTLDFSLTGKCISDKWGVWPYISKEFDNDCKDFSDYGFYYYQNLGLEINLVDSSNSKTLTQGVWAELPKQLSLISTVIHIEVLETSKDGSPSMFLVGFVDKESRELKGNFFTFYSRQKGDYPLLYLTKDLALSQSGYKGLIKPNEEIKITCIFDPFPDKKVVNCEIKGESVSEKDIEIELREGVESIFIGYSWSPEGKIIANINDFYVSEK